MQPLYDKTIKCVDCGDLFDFTAGEQKYYSHPDRQYPDPKRCIACRVRRKSNNNERNFQIGRGK